MENKINIAQLLKDCPKGMELDCTMWDNVTLKSVDIDSIYPIVISYQAGELTYTAEFTEYGCWNQVENAKCVIFPKGKTTWEGFVPPCKFEDGDVLVHTQNQRFIMSIYHERTTELTIKAHCILWDKDEGLSVGKEICCYVDSVRLATEEEKQKLFKAIKEYGYRWNEETKTLEKLIEEPKFKVGDRIVHKVNKESPFTITEITNDYYKGGTQYEILIEQQDNFELAPDKFNINTLTPFESRVLVRDTNSQDWTGSFYSHYNIKDQYPFYCINYGKFKQCIPYEGNEHLLGTTNDCDNFYKTWEK